jgi:prepilin-type N-terminal cleavage/methylation domain-containing protein
MRFIQIYGIISAMKIKKSFGFTLLEILLVVAAIAILAAIVIRAINPSKQLAETRNAQRHSDVQAIMDAVYQYSIDNDGTLPTSISTGGACTDTTNEICKTGAVSCTNLTSLTDITGNQKYLVSIPIDPKGESTYGAGYHIHKNGFDRVTVCAPDAEQSATISISK